MMSDLRRTSPRKGIAGKDTAGLWAKSSRGSGPGELLTTHTQRVVRALCQLAERLPYAAEQVEEPRLWHRAYWACWLHDLGKAAHAFQAVLRGQRKQWDHRHEVLSLAFLPLVCERTDPDFAWIAAAIASHHKDAHELFSIYDVTLPIEYLQLDALSSELSQDDVLSLITWLYKAAQRDYTRAQAWRWGVLFPSATLCPDVGDALLSTAQQTIFQALEAYDRLYRRLKREPATSRSNRQAVLLRGLLTLADHLASARAPRVQVLQVPETSVLFERAGMQHVQPRSHQRALATTPGSVVMAAPTGSGKTEAALLWARRQTETERVSPRLVYLLPYQASLNAMRRRLKQVLGADVALLHGRSAQAIFRELSEQGYTPQEAERAARRAEDLARLQQPPVWVTTPYQLLRAAYRLRGYEGLWTSLQGSLVIVDEVHAYEPERLGLIVGLLRELVTEWGVRVCAFSATMPTWLHQLLSETLQASSPPRDDALFAQFQRHRLELIDGQLTDSSVIDHICQEVAAGRSVLIGANTVARAQELYTLLRQRLRPEQLELLHSRFTGRDRLAKEQRIIKRLAPGHAQTALAVVATQVIEVSLNLDFERIVTEPAPLEALAQRFGRVNRLGRYGIVPVWVLTQPTDGQGVYDQRLVKRTLDVLRQHADGKVLNEALLSDWLDHIYAGELAAEWLQRIERHQQEFARACLAALRAFDSADESLAEQFDQLFDGTEVLPAQLQAEYQRLREHSVFDAQGLLVPVSHIRRLKAYLRWHHEWRLNVADLPYEPQNGLTLP